MNDHIDKIKNYINNAINPFVLLFSPIDLLFITLLGIALFYGRWFSIVYPLPLNPDEVQMAANALRIVTNGFNWDALDGTTSGPLNSLVLTWPYLFGGEVTLSSTRFTAAALLFLISTLLYLTLKNITGTFVSVLLVAPLALFYSYTINAEFLHYSSELFPLFLLVAANYIFTSILGENITSSKIKVVAIGLLLGCVPFAKLQAAPIAVIIGLFSLLAIVIYSRKQKNQLILYLISGALAPTIIILLPLSFAGKLSDFWLSYIVWASHYIKDSSSTLTILTMINVDPVFKYVSYFLASLLLFILTQARLSSSGSDQQSHFDRFSMIYAVSLFVVSFWVISKPGNAFPHYLMFFPPFLILFAACSARLISRSRRGKLYFSLYYILLLFSFSQIFVGNVLKTDSFIDYHDKYKTELDQMYFFKSPDLFSWIPSTSNHLLVWGWMPQWYLWSGYSPATRESHTYAQVVQSPLTGYFRERFISDLSLTSPGIIIDAAVGKSFGFNDPAMHSPQIFGELTEIISNDYTLLSSFGRNSECPKIYVSKEIDELLDQKMIVPQSIFASDTWGGDASPHSIEKVFDLSVTEDSCIDYWLLPENKTGSIVLNLHKSEIISRIMILNTQNSTYLDRATKDIELNIFDGESVVFSKKIELKPYPLWNVVDLEQQIISDRISINVLSYHGRGAGLNEIKMFRAN